MTKDPKKILDFLIMEMETLEIECDPRSIQRARDLCQMAGLQENETQEVVLGFLSAAFKLEDRTTLDLMKLYNDVKHSIMMARDGKAMAYYDDVATAIEQEARGR